MQAITYLIMIVLMPTSKQQENHKGWQARLKLEFKPGHRRTILGACKHYGPLTVQRPFYPEDGACHLYILHPPGGLVGGDLLELDVTVESRAFALITTPGATKFYRSAGSISVQKQNIMVKAGGAFEWLPQENIIFAGAKADISTHIDLEAGARFMGWEIICLGRPVNQERFISGSISALLAIIRQGVPLLFDRLRVSNAKDLDRGPGLRGFPVTASFVATNVKGSMLDSLREMPCLAEATAGLTLIDDLLVVRYLGNSTQQARQIFQDIRARLRPQLIGLPACSPRIWAT